MKLIVPRLGDVINAAASRLAELTLIVTADHGGFLNLVLAQEQVHAAGQVDVRGVIVFTHPVDAENIRSPRHPQNREVGAVLHFRVHQYPWGSLYNIGQIVPAVRNFGYVLLFHGRAPAALLPRNERSPPRHPHTRAYSCTSERHTP